MTDALNILRKDAFRKRVHGIPGGNHVLWAEKDLVEIHNHVMSVKMEQIIAPPPPAETKLLGAANVDKVALAKIGIEMRDFNPDDSGFLALITNSTVDHVRDSVDPRGVDDGLFAKNAPVLDSHDSSKPPVATSGRTFLSGDNRLAIFRFPKAGVSANSDQISGAIRARLLRGISIGFLPRRWSFSKSADRPLGIDFHEVTLLEFSVCAIPANPDCYILGSVASNQSAPSSDPKTAALRREARALADKGRAMAASITAPKPSTREQRIAEAQALIRASRS